MGEMQRANPFEADRQLEDVGLARSSYDFNTPCMHCGYRIPPRELLPVDGERVKCPQCGKLTLYIPKKST